METFYNTVAGACFALLGLWWVVVQLKYDLWMRDAERRRIAYHLSLYFLLPGLMSLAALLASENSLFWRSGFALAGLLGLVNTVSVIRQPAASLARLPYFAAGKFLVAVVYLFIILCAAGAEVVRTVGLTPIEAEGVAVVLLLFLGVNFAWLFFAEADRP